MKTWKHRMKFKSGALQWDRDSDWHDDKYRKNVWATVDMSSSREEMKRAISDAARFMLQVPWTDGCKISFDPREHHQ